MRHSLCVVLLTVHETIMARLHVFRSLVSVIVDKHMVAHLLTYQCLFSVTNVICLIAAAIAAILGYRAFLHPL